MILLEKTENYKKHLFLQKKLRKDINFIIHIN